ncbi:MAG: aspartate-semialdehyde dehydrogenase, partial [Candidatus Latescibacterota bacterium]
MSDRYNVAIMGATGAVGQIFLELLAERDFPMDELRLLASSRSAGKELNCGERMVKVQELTGDSFDGI